MPGRDTARLDLLAQLGADGAAAEAASVSHFVVQGYADWNGIRQGGWVKAEAASSGSPIWMAVSQLKSQPCGRRP